MAYKIQDTIFHSLMILASHSMLLSYSIVYVAKESDVCNGLCQFFPSDANVEGQRQSLRLGCRAQVAKATVPEMRSGVLGSTWSSAIIQSDYLKPN